MTLKSKFHYTDKGIPFLGVEEIPDEFIVNFTEIQSKDFPEVKVTVSDLQAGDIINDNSYENDGYRYHDVFHYTFATILNWSPCTRAMLKRKRKSNITIDRIEDGARAIITEEAISLMIFSDAKANNYYADSNDIDNKLIEMIKKMVSPFEVREKSSNEWKKAILNGYDIFRKLNFNKGGIVKFNRINKTIDFKPN